MATLAQNIRRAINDFDTIEDAIVRKGVSIPEGTPTSEYGEKILSIETGVDTSGDTVVPSALREGFTAHNAAGQPITGTIPDYSGGNTVEMTSPEGATLNTAGTYCEGNIEVVPKLQSKTATTGEIITADAGYVGLESVDTNPAFEAGKKSEYDAFWDAAQNYGKRTEYARAFDGPMFRDENFKPKYDMFCAGRADAMFLYSTVSNIAESLERAGVILDFSKATSLYQTFANSYTQALGIIDCTSSTSLYAMLQDARNLVRIEKLIFKEEPYGSNVSCFRSCVALEWLEIDGPIVNTGFDFSWSPLSKASLTSIINALSSTTTGLIVTLRKAAVDTAFETTTGAADGSTSEEWTALIATKPNWTINLINS